MIELIVTCDPSPGSITTPKSLEQQNIYMDTKINMKECGNTERNTKGGNHLLSAVPSHG